MRSMSGKWPPGPYAVEVTSVSNPTMGLNNHDKRMLVMRIIGTDAQIQWYVSASPAAAWTWRDIPRIESFDELHRVVGRKFIVFIDQAKYTGGAPRRKGVSDVINQIKVILCEIVED